MLTSIEILGRTFPMYGVMFFIGVAVACGVAMLIVKRAGIERYDFVYAGVFTMIGAGIGAKLLFIIVSWKIIMEYGIIAAIFGGFVFYGGLLGGIFGLWLYTHMYKLPTIRFFEVASVVLPLGHAFGRVGCYFGGCCYGMPYDGPFAVTYTHTLGDTPLGIPLLPTQLIEAAFLVLLFAVQLALYFRFTKKGAENLNGKNVLVYLASYSIFRFVLEFFRGDKIRGDVLSITTSQWISLGLFISAVILLIRIVKKKTKV